MAQPAYYPPPDQRQYPCAFCGNPLTFITQYQQWYCYRCQRYAGQPVSYRQSQYPGLYQQPPQQTRLRFDILSKILFRPRAAFIELYQHTSMSQGLIMALILVFISSLISICASLIRSFALLGSYGMPNLPPTLGSIALVFAIGLALTVIMLMAMGWLTAKFTKVIGQGRDDANKTTGFLGYGQIVNFVTGIVTSALMALGIITIYTTQTTRMSSAYTTSFIVSTVMIGVISVIGFVWSLWVDGTAASVANDVSVGVGIASYLLALIIIVLIVVGITAAMAAAFFIWISTAF